MNTLELPTRDEMLAALMARDAAYDGVFVAAIRTTGIFCRPSCTARKPYPRNVQFFPSPDEAQAAGFRPCLRCRPLDDGGGTPAWIATLLRDVDADPARRWTDQDLRTRRLNPDRVRRWFQQHHHMTFHGFARARRLGLALGRIQGGDAVIASALDHGFDSLSGFNDAFRRLFGDAPTRLGGTRPLSVRRIATPLGAMVAAAGDGGLYLLEFDDRRMLETQIKRLRQRLDVTLVPGTHPVLDQTQRELGEYFAGTRRNFSLPLATPGTPFQQRVWQRLLAIPHGATASYADIARAIGQPDAVRAVARANGDNRLAIVIPCHRVIGADGKLTGYGGGLWRKQRLLDLERGRSSAGLAAAR